jgi:hypothetical protein
MLNQNFLLYWHWVGQTGHAVVEAKVEEIALIEEIGDKFVILALPKLVSHTDVFK